MISDGNCDLMRTKESRSLLQNSLDKGHKVKQLGKAIKRYVSTVNLFKRRNGL